MTRLWTSNKLLIARLNMWLWRPLNLFSSCLSSALFTLALSPTVAVILLFFLPKINKTHFKSSTYSAAVFKPTFYIRKNGKSAWSYRTTFLDEKVANKLTMYADQDDRPSNTMVTWFQKAALLLDSIRRISLCIYKECFPTNNVTLEMTAEQFIFDKAEELQIQNDTIHTRAARAFQSINFALNVSLSCLHHILYSSRFSALWFDDKWLIARTSMVISRETFVAHEAQIQR